MSVLCDCENTPLVSGITPARRSSFNVTLLSQRDPFGVHHSSHKAGQRLVAHSHAEPLAARRLSSQGIVFPLINTRSKIEASNLNFASLFFILH